MRRPREPDPIVFTIGKAVDRKDIPALCARLRALLESSAGDSVICDVGGPLRADTAAVDALARLLLTARRSGRQFRVRRASAELRDLLALMGLSGLVPLESIVALPPQGQPEEGEQPRGVEEEADPGNATV